MWLEIWLQDGQRGILESMWPFRDLLKTFLPGSKGSAVGRYYPMAVLVFYCCAVCLLHTQELFNERTSSIMWIELSRNPYN